MFFNSRGQVEVEFIFIVYVFKAHYKTGYLNELKSVNVLHSFVNGNTQNCKLQWKHTWYLVNQILATELSA